MRKKLLIIAIAVALIATGVFHVVDSSPQVRAVGGTLSPNEVTEVRHAVRSAIWRDTFTGFSSKGIKSMPGAIKREFKDHIILIGLSQFNFNDSPRTNALAKMSVQSAGSNNFYYELLRETNGWRCVGKVITTSNGRRLIFKHTWFDPKR